MQNRNYKRISFVSRAMVMAGNQAVEGMTANISLGGMFVTASQRLPVGDAVLISMEMPSMSRGSTITLNGVVVRSSSMGMGVRFVPLNHETFAHLRSVINRKSWSAIREIAPDRDSRGSR